jgi:vancomycin permeability regulator SanA
MKKALFIILIVLLMAAALVAVTNYYVIKSGEKDIVTTVDSSDISLDKSSVRALQNLKPDCILVLGAAVSGDTPSKMLQDRLDVAVALYYERVADKLLLSGDNGQVNYNEVVAMKKYVLEAGVPAEDIFLDYAGFSTYESMYRARDVFLVESAVVVTQKYHLYRALQIGRALGLTVRGVASNQEVYDGQEYRDLREVAARVKDVIQTILQLKPTFLGPEIPISGNGEVTQ